MKKDEAISILATSARPREPKNRTRYDEAVKMAIEALRQPEQRSSSCGQDNDPISRRAAIDMIMGQPPEPHYPSWYAEQIKGLPSAQPERKTGRWYDVGSLSCRCSACGCKSQRESMFCPNCGARMEGGDENGET